MASRLYGLLWRWHFLAGMAAFPILFVVALTGALYAFQPELERVVSSDLWVVEPAGPRRPLDELVAVAATRCKPGGIYAPSDRDRSLIVSCEGTGPQREIYVDPYRAEILGERVVRYSLFGIIFQLHWDLFLDDYGRLAIEWATSWGLVLMALGAALWWPRGKRRGGGVWYPRRLEGRQWLRDLHSVLGAYALPVLLLVVATGLMFTLRAGEQRWHPLTEDSGHDVFDHPPKSTVVAKQPRIGYDRALFGAGMSYDTADLALYTSPPPRPEDAYLIFHYDDHWVTPSINRAVWVDAYSGAQLQEVGWNDRGVAGRFDMAKYSIHIGSLLDLPGRIAACIAALILAALCVTGPWMWWKRRPRGGLGVPPRGRRAPWLLLAGLAITGWVLPLVGWTLIAVVIVELLRLGVQRVRAGRAAPLA